MAYESVFEDMTGNENPKRATVARFTEALPWAAVSCGFNFAGSGLVKLVEAEVADLKPNWPHISVFIVAVVAVLLKAMFPNQEPFHNVVRELAAGMAGNVGSEIWGALRSWWHRTKWEKGKTYKKGDHVSHDSKVWEALKDVPADAEPGKDDTAWSQVVHKSKDTKDTKDGKPAQGVEMDIAGMAQAFLGDERRIEAICFDVSTLLGDKGQFGDEETKKRFMAQCKEVLTGVIKQFATA